MHVQAYKYPAPQVIQELSAHAMSAGSEYRYMELPEFYGPATEIVHDALNEKLPAGWDKIFVLGAAELVQAPQGEKRDAGWPGQCVVENQKAYVLVNIDEDINRRDLDLNSAALAVKLLTHEIAGHAIGTLRALGQSTEVSSEEEDHLRMTRPLDGSEGENIYLDAMRKVLPLLNVDRFPGLQEAILEEYPHISRDAPRSEFDDLLKRAFLHHCISDIEQQVIDHLGSDIEIDSDVPDPAVVKRCEELVEPMRALADYPDHSLWATALRTGRDQ